MGLQSFIDRDVLARNIAFIKPRSSTNTYPPIRCVHSITEKAKKPKVGGDFGR